MDTNNPAFVDEREAKPEAGKEVYICVMRRAKLIEGKWALAQPEPIDLLTDTVYWMEIPPTE